MELATRKSLFHVLNRDNLNVGWPQALEWGAQAAGGTACLHQHNIVHRDLKSLNLLVTQDWVIKVADFGLARFNSEGNLETLSKMRGTMAYCVPECDEILTNRGFMNLAAYEAAAAADRDGSLRVASFDPARNALTYEAPRRVVVQPRATRTLVEFGGAKSGSGVGSRVTQEHRMYAQVGGKRAPFKKIEAGHYFHDATLDAIRQKTAAPAGYDGGNRPSSVAELLDLIGGAGNVTVRAAAARAHDGDSGDDASVRLFLELFGVWLCRSDADLRVVDAPAALDSWLRAALTTLFADRWSGVGAALAVHDEQWNACFDRCVPSRRAAPWWMWTLDAAAVRSFLRGVRRGAGGSVLTASVRFRDELVQLCLQAGYTAHFEQQQQQQQRRWAVHWSDAGALVEPTLRKSRGEVRERQYTGRVWCFTMPSGFIWTRRVLARDGGVVTAASRPLLTGQCPPEAYFAQAFDYKSDVYSLAVILWELANRALKGKYEAPFSEYKNLTMDFQIIIQVAKAHLRPTIPELCPQPVRDLIEGAWVFNRDDRPTADDLQGNLRQLIEVYEGEVVAWDAAIKNTMLKQK